MREQMQTAIYEGKQKITCLFLPVLWENHADPIITGREQLGFSKIYADMRCPIRNGKIITASASSWGFKFMELECNAAEVPDDPEILSKVLHNPNYHGIVHYKYIPNTDDMTKSDVSQYVFTPYAWNPPADLDAKSFPEPKCQPMHGKIKWNSATFEQMPTQHMIVSALAALEVKRFIGAEYTFSYSNNDLLAQYALE